MNDTKPETELAREIDRATCKHCRSGSVPVCQDGELGWYHQINQCAAPKWEACTSQRVALLPIIERAVQLQDQIWCEALEFGSTGSNPQLDNGWEELGKIGARKQLAEHSPLIERAVAGAYAAAAEHWPNLYGYDMSVHCSCGWASKRQDSQTEWLEHIRALTPADATAAFARAVQAARLEGRAEEAKVTFAARWGTHVVWSEVLNKPDHYSPSCEFDARHIAELERAK